MLIAGYVNSLKMHQYILAHPKHRSLLEAWGAFPPNRDCEFPVSSSCNTGGSVVRAKAGVVSFCLICLLLNFLLYSLLMSSRE